MKLWPYIRDKMLRHPGQIVCEKEAHMTFEELVVFAEAFSQKLRGEKSCAIYCQSEMAAAMVLLACFAAEVTAVPLSERYGVAHCRKVLHTIDPSCIVTDWENELQIYHVKDSDYKVPEEHPALIMCTSGTTGSPKGVMLSQENIIANVCDISEYFDVSQEDSILISRPIYHCAVLTGEFLLGLAQGCKIVFSSEMFNPARLIRLMETHQITTFGGTPTLLNALSKFIRGNNALKNVVVSGECLNETVAQNIRKTFPDAKVYHVYGLTEAAPRVSYMPPEHFDSAPTCVGVPLSSVHIKILNRLGKPVRKGEKGTLWIQGPNITKGYYNNRKQTVKTIRNGWLCTGDTAVITDKGWLKILGRHDDLIIRAGMNIYPQEIENELRKDSRTKEVLAYGYTDANSSTQIALEIVGDYTNEDEVKDLCLKVLPSFQVPTKILIVPELQKNGSGKIVRVRKDG